MEGAADFEKLPSEKSDLDEEPALAQADTVAESEVEPQALLAADI